MKFTAIDLFCGAGGLTTGLQMAGFDVLAGVEINPVAAETYLMNHPNHKMYSSDIRNLDPELVMRELNLKKGELDLLAGCPPCQGFSTHRTRNRASSVQDVRNDLVFEFLRFAQAFLPKTLMMENVPGLAKDPRIEYVKNELENLGYIFNKNSIQVKNASHFGVPQRRRRMILQASRLGEISDAEASAEKKTVFQCINHLKEAGDSGDALHDYKEKRTAKTLNLIRQIPLNGGSRKDLPEDLWLPCHKRNPNSYKDVYGRMAWDDVAPTITGGCTNPSKGRFLHPEKHRAITLREAALLQTFPQDYKFSLRKGKEPAALMIGNALPPEFIRRHAIKYREHLHSITRREHE